MDEDVTDILAECSALMETRPGHSCPRCQAAVDIRLLQVDMSQFEGKLLSQIRCEACGYTAAETVPPDVLDYLGGHFELKLSEASQWQERVLIKSTTTTFSIPEIGLDAARAGSVERTTVYDLLQFTCADLAKSPAFQDVGDAEGTLQMANFLQELREVMDNGMDATLILQDPRQQMCYIEKKLNSDGVDPHLTTTPSADG